MSKNRLNEIEKWLRKPDFKRGVELYDRLGTSKSLKRYFRFSDESKEVMDKLTYELSQLKDTI